MLILIASGWLFSFLCTQADGGHEKPSAAHSNCIAQAAFVLKTEERRAAAQCGISTFYQQALF
jgi:hypothetical protein